MMKTNIFAFLSVIAISFASSVYALDTHFAFLSKTARGSRKNFCSSKNLARNADCGFRAILVTAVQLVFSTCRALNQCTAENSYPVKTMVTLQLTNCFANMNHQAPNLGLSASDSESETYDKLINYCTAKNGLKCSSAFGNQELGAV